MSTWAEEQERRSHVPPPAWTPPDQPWYPGIDVFDTRVGPTAAAKKKKGPGPGYAGGILDAFFGRGAYTGDPYAPGTQQTQAALLGSIVGGLPSQVNATSTDQILQSMLQNSPTRTTGAGGTGILPSLTSSGVSLQDYLSSLGSLSGLAGGTTLAGAAGTTGGLSLADLLSGHIGGMPAPGYEPQPTGSTYPTARQGDFTEEQLLSVGEEWPDDAPLPKFAAMGPSGNGGTGGLGPTLAGLVTIGGRPGDFGPGRGGQTGGSATNYGPGAGPAGAGGGSVVEAWRRAQLAAGEEPREEEEEEEEVDDPYAAYRQFLPPASNYVPEGGGMFFDESTYQPFDIATDPAFQERYAAPEPSPEDIAAKRQELVKSGQHTQAEVDAMPDSKIWEILVPIGLEVIGSLIGSQGATRSANAEMQLLREMREQNLAGGLYAGDLGAQAASLAANELIGSRGLAGQTMSGAYLQTGDIQADAAQRAADVLANAILSGGQYKTDAAGRLYDAAVATGREGVDIQEQKLQRALQGLSPYTGAGETAVGQQLAETLAGPGDYKLSDEYQFMLDQGLREAKAQLSQQGLGQSGRHVVAATKLAENVASQAEQQQFNNWLNRQQALGNLSQMGLSGATTGGQLAAGTGASQADTLLAAQRLAQEAGLYGAEAGGGALERAGGAQSAGIRDIANAISTGIMGSSGSLADMYIGQGEAAAGGYTGAADARTQALLAALGLNVPVGQQQATAAGNQYINQANAWTGGLSNLSDLLWLLQGNTGGGSGLSAGF